MMFAENNISIVGEACTGCGACADICHKNAISFGVDREGFVYPIVSELCINCGSCLKSCHTTSNTDKVSIIKSYVAITKDFSLYKRAVKM